MAWNRVSALALLGFGLCFAAGASQARDRGADGKFSERRSRHFTLRQDVAIDEYSGHRGSRRFELTVLETLETAYDALGNLVGIRPGRPVEIFVYDPAIFDAEFAGLFRFQAAGFFHGVIRVRGGSSIDATLVHTLYHEYVHAALAQAAPASVVVPAWMNEGFAEWFAHRLQGKRQLSGGEWNFLNRALEGGELPSLTGLNTASFSHLGPRAASISYIASYAAVDHLIGRFGEDRFGAFLKDYIRTRNLSRSLRRNYRMDLPDLDRALADSLT